MPAHHQVSKRRSKRPHRKTAGPDVQTVVSDCFDFVRRALFACTSLSLIVLGYSPRLPLVSASIIPAAKIKLAMPPKKSPVGISRLSVPKVALFNGERVPKVP